MPIKTYNHTIPGNKKRARIAKTQAPAKVERRYQKKRWSSCWSWFAIFEIASSRLCNCWSRVWEEAIPGLYWKRNAEVGSWKWILFQIPWNEFQGYEADKHLQFNLIQFYYSKQCAFPIPQRIAKNGVIWYIELIFLRFYLLRFMQSGIPVFQTSIPNHLIFSDSILLVVKTMIRGRHGFS